MSVDGKQLRQMMRRAPSPVVVVTARNEGRSRGITIGSLTSVSLDPPLVSFNVGRSSQMYPVIYGAPTFVVHLLGSEHTPLADWFARPDLSPEEQFEGIAYRPGPGGAPILDEAPAVMVCRASAVLEVGDHIIVVGEVTHVERRRAFDAFVYYERAYHHIGGRIHTPGPGGSSPPSAD